MIGGDMLLNKYKYNIKQRIWSRRINPERTSEKSLGTISASAIISNFVLRSYTFYIGSSVHVGVFQVLASLLIAFILSQISLLLYIKTWSYNSKNTYCDIWKSIYGSELVLIPCILELITFLYLSFFSIHSTILSFRYVLQTFDYTGKFFSNQWFYLLVIPCISCVPLMFWMNLKRFYIYSYISLASYFICVTALAAFLIKYLIENGNSVDIGYWNTKVSESMASFIQCIEIFYVHPFVSAGCYLISGSTQSQIYTVSWGVSSLNLCLSSIILISDYLIKEDGSIFQKVSDDKKFSAVLQVSILIKTFLTTPQYVFCVIDSFIRIFHFNIDESYYSVRYLTVLMIIFFSASLSFATSLATTIFQRIYQISQIVMMFILPCTIYLIMFGFTSKMWGIIAVLLILQSLIIFAFIIRDIVIL